MQASTTGNIYGIYDMSGGAWEYIPAYVDNGNNNLNTGSVILNSDSKYKDLYVRGTTDSQLNNYALAASHKGDAMYETSASNSGATSWNSDYSSMIRTDSPWLFRGGHSYNATSAGCFAFYYNNGHPYSNITFRPVVLVANGL